MAFVASAASAYHDTTSDTHAFLGASAPQQHHRYAVPSAPSIPNQNHPPHYPQVMSDIKPRLTKEQHDILEGEFQKQPKPSTLVKKAFAEQLNVSLDKVNNWFQNRRAKSKQDAKKAQSSFNLYAQQGASSLNLTSDSDTSPAFAPSDYLAIMDDDPFSNGVTAAQPAHFPEQPHLHGLLFHSDLSSGDSFGSMEHQQPAGEPFDSPQDMNRRTLTQEQFNAFAQAQQAHSTGHFTALQHDFSGDADILNQVFPDMHGGEFKPQDAYAFPVALGAPLSSNDPSVPSAISDQSMFPSATAMRNHAALSTTCSDWGDSRSSFASLPQEPSLPSSTGSHQHPATTSSSQWQPGQSVPVDVSDLQRQFTEAEQRAQQQQARRQAHQQERQFQHEQPLDWPADEAYARRESQNSTILTEQISGFGIQTPQPPLNSTFKVPVHLQANGGSIAARRQRPRPADLGMAAMRSQSYGGAISPIQRQVCQNLIPGQPLRRIRSSNVMNGGIAQGRVMKSTPGSAQRSPMAWTFQDAMNSPNVNTATRHASTSGNLAPPTPLSPSDLSGQEQARPQFPPWQPLSGDFGRQASISETDAEHIVATSGQSQSPPPTPTPMYHSQHQAMAHGRIGNTVITENTPPQSAPAVQTTFPAHPLLPVTQPQPQPQTTQVQPQAQPAFIHAPVQHYMNEQQYQLAVSYGAISAPDMQAGLQMPFPSGVPIVNEHGQLTLACPQQMQQIPQMQFVQPAPQHLQQMAQAGQYDFMSSSGVSPSVHVTAQAFKQSSGPEKELFFHEYSPPSEIRRAVTPRKTPSDSLPKQFTFANQGPEHFEKYKARRGAKASGTASGSPSSASPA